MAPSCLESSAMHKLEHQPYCLQVASRLFKCLARVIGSWWGTVQITQKEGIYVNPSILSGFESVVFMHFIGTVAYAHTEIE